MIAARFQAVVIGASAGAIEALSAILPLLPRHFLPVIIVVHVPPDKKSMLADIFSTKCEMVVKEAEDKEAIKNGTIYFAPPDYHLQVEPNFALSLSSEEALLFSRPSIDILFETAADAYGEHLIGVLLTGANRDGAEGLKTIIEKGGMALVQNPKHAYAGTMPEAGLALCPEAISLELSQIAGHLMKVHIV